jgi:heptosyltransferase-2
MNLKTKINLSDAEDVVRKFIPESKKALIGVAPGATYGAAKRWSPEKFAEVADKLNEKFYTQGIILGGKSDGETANEVQKMARVELINLAGKTSLLEAIYLISQCRLFLSNDSGLMHIAGALNVPTVAIFGSTNPVTTSPVGKNSVIVRKEVSCSPCLKKTCPTDFRCMNHISVEDVFKAAQDLLQDNGDKNQ